MPTSDLPCFSVSRIEKRKSTLCNIACLASSPRCCYNGDHRCCNDLSSFNGKAFNGPFHAIEDTDKCHCSIGILCFSQNSMIASLFVAFVVISCVMLFCLDICGCYEIQCQCRRVQWDAEITTHTPKRLSTRGDERQRVPLHSTLLLVMPGGSLLSIAI